MQHSRVAIAAVLAAVALSIAGCGTDKAAEAAKEKAAQQQAARAKERAAERRQEAAAKKMAAAESDACQQMLGDLVDAVGEVTSRLDVGLNFSEYSDAVADAHVIYDRVDFDGLSDHPRCLSDVGIPAETALNQLSKGVSLWSDCLDDYSCDFDTDVDPKIQPKWSKASTSITDARQALRDLADPTTYTAADLKRS